MDILSGKPIFEQLTHIHERALKYFDATSKAIPEDDEEESNSRTRWSPLWGEREYWKELPEKLRSESSNIASNLAELAQRTGPAIRRAPLLTEADERTVSHAFKGMRAALRLQNFRHEDVEILHDEGTFLAVQPERDSYNDID